MFVGCFEAIFLFLLCWLGVDSKGGVGEIAGVIKVGDSDKGVDVLVVVANVVVVAVVGM